MQIKSGKVLCAFPGRFCVRGHFAAVQQVPNSKQGMSPHHPRPGPAHHCFDMTTARFNITMRGTFIAGRFVFAVRASLNSPVGVFEQIGALPAEAVVVAMLLSIAVHADHNFNGLLFAVQASG